ncbi:MAG: hypothetical protein DCC75_06705 [Proteobacteria bacterium]|nr:MAG: hypothetical protein DCC75_06705 [Pseudomonadota bacterium]
MNSLGFSTFGNPSSDDLLAAVPAFVLNMVDQYGYASELLDFADSLSASQRTYAFQLLNGVSASRWNSYRSLIEQSLATAPSALALYGGIMNLDVTDERSRHIIYWTWAQSSNSLLTSPTPQECVPLEAVEAEQAPDQH